MSFQKLLIGTTLAAACLGFAQPTLAETVAESSETLISQTNIGQTTQVSGTVIDVVGDRVRVRTPEGAIEFYDIPREQQDEAGVQIGSPVTITLQDDEVVAVAGPSGETVEIVAVDDLDTNDDLEETTTTQQQTTVEETTIQRQPTTTTQQPATTQPQTTQQPAAQPVRALW